MAGNGEIVWSDWLTGAGRIGVQLFWDPPVPGQTTVVVHFWLWWRQAPTADAYMLSGTVQTMFISPTVSDGATWTNAVQPVNPSVTGPYDYHWATRLITVPVQYGSTVRVHGSGFILNQMGDAASASATADVYLEPIPPYAPAVPGTPVPYRTVAGDGSTITVTWARAGSADSAAYIYQNQAIQYQTNDDPNAYDLGTIGGSATSVEHSVVGNSRYRYRVQAGNSTGVSGWSAWSSWIYTKPSAPTIQPPLRSSSTVIAAKWLNTASYRTGTTLGWSTNGGAETNPGVTAAVSDTSANVTVGASSTNAFRAYHQITGVPLLAGGTMTLVSDPSDWSPTVQALGAPSAPLISQSATAIDATRDSLTIGFTHQPTDGTAQTAAEVRWRLNAGSWTTVSLTTAVQTVFNSGTFANSAANTYEFQARTKGSDATWSAYSASVYLKTSAAPTVVITYPSGVHPPNDTFSFSVTYSDPEGKDHHGWEFQLLDATSAVIWSAAYDSLWLHTGMKTPADGPKLAEANYTLRARAKDGDDVWSNWVTSTYSPVFTVPTAPTIIGTPSWNEYDGAATITARTPASVPSDGPYLQLLRQEPDSSWQECARVEGVGNSTSYALTDPIPPLVATINYRVVVGYRLKASSPTATSVYARSDGWVHVNGGPNWSVHASLRGNKGLTLSPSRDKALWTPQGRTAPMELIGDGRMRVWRLSGDVAKKTYQERELGTQAVWDAISDMPAPLCFRDHRGHKVFGSISGVSIDVISGGVSATITEGDYVG